MDKVQPRVCMHCRKTCEPSHFRFLLFVLDMSRSEDELCGFHYNVFLCVTYAFSTHDVTIYV